jgi:hypothetical protein
VVGSDRPVSEGKRTKSEPLAQTLLTKSTATLRLANRWAVAMKRVLDPSAAAAASIRRSRRRWPCIV